MSIQFPSVPIGSIGVPPVMQSIGSVVGTVATLAADVQGIMNLFGPSQWGVFDGTGAQAFPDTNCASVEMRSAYKVADHPVEGGAFAAYNKVKVPTEWKVVLVSDGSSKQSTTVGYIPFMGGARDTRTTFLADLDRAIADLTAYQVITPEQHYILANPTGYNYTRKTHGGGATMIVAEITFHEIRVITNDMASTPYSPSQPDGASATSGGSTSPATPSPAQTPSTAVT